MMKKKHINGNINYNERKFCVICLGKITLNSARMVCSQSVSVTEGETGIGRRYRSHNNAGTHF